MGLERACDEVALLVWSRHILDQLGTLDKDKGHVQGYLNPRVVGHHTLTVKSSRGVLEEGTNQ
jgi:hypothetical protein